jgi:N-sulfoglucosamine sulfohydrolase
MKPRKKSSTKLTSVSDMWQEINSRLFLILLSILYTGANAFENAYHVQGNPSGKPNIVLIIADDLTFRDMEPYGSDQVKTPHLSRLAKNGKCLDNMFTSTAMCAPTRQQILTGMYPIRNGAYPNHSQVYPGTRSAAHHMQALGYNTALIGKKHYGPENSFPFQYLGGRGHDSGDGQDLNLGLAEDFIMRSKDKPYFLVVASNQPHTPWNRGNTNQYSPEAMKLPPDLVDTDETRRQISRYYAEISYLDSLVGACLDMIERSGEPENTIVMFTSEQGSSAPFGKWTCYDNGLKTAFIVRWPGRIKAGSRTSAMTQYVDVVPTIIEMAGGDPSTFVTGRKDAAGRSGFDGGSFLKVLTSETDEFRKYVFGAHTTRGIIQGSESYPIRSARSNKYLYIQNLNAGSSFSNTVSNSSLFKSWSETGRKEDLKRAHAYTKRPAEELYDVEKDPYQLVNLAGEVSLKNVQDDLRMKLKEWMKQQGDRGLETEMLALERQPKKSDPVPQKQHKTGKNKKKAQ